VVKYLSLAIPYQIGYLRHGKKFFSPVGSSSTLRNLTVTSVFTVSNSKMEQNVFRSSTNDTFVYIREYVRRSQNNENLQSN
jgi:hypothetical protein